MDIKVGDKVKTTARKDYNTGETLMPSVNSTVYDVIQIGAKGRPDDYVVIGKGKQVTAAVRMSELTKVSGSATETPPTPTVAPADTSKSEYDENALTSEGIDEAMKAFLESGNSEDILKYNMRLFGVPHQFTQYCDYRTFSTQAARVRKSKEMLIGRKFIENIFLEAPVVSIIPGKPLYLPAARNKKGLSHALLSAANGNLSALTVVLKEENANEKLRYYDFQQDYFKYMEYVNILCSTAAAFLDLEEFKMDSPNGDGGIPLVQYKWQNYRWNTNGGYKMVAVETTKRLAEFTSDMIMSMVDTLKTGGKKALNAITSFFNGQEGNEKKAQESSPLQSMFKSNEDDEPLLDVLEEITTTCNFVQFYVDPRSGASESGSNDTQSSHIEGFMSAGQDFLKEVAFVASASGTIDMEAFQESIDSGMDEMNSRLTSNRTGAIGGILSRLTSITSNVIKGDNMIFPKIYQRSNYQKSYSIIVDLVSPYGNRLSYYLNVLVPLFHLLALAIPKQGTANTYSAPFLIRAYYPGVFSCNLGIVSSIQIDKDPDGDSYSVDGYPCHIKVTLNIEDLYSDLMMTPAGDVTLFLSNSSLIEYIATNCGVNLITPQLKTKAKMYSSVINTVFSGVTGNVTNAIFGSLEKLINSMVGV